MARSLPPQQRRDLARRLLASAERELDAYAAETPQPKGICTYDELHEDPSRGNSSDEVKAYFEANWSGEQS